MKISINAAKLVLSFVIFASKDAVATVTSSQGDSEVIVGGTMVISCVTSLEADMFWYHYPVGSNEQKYIYTYGTMRLPYSNRCEMRINSTTGSFQLVISGVELTDAGIFSCQEDDGTGDHAQIQLTVLEAGPACSPTKIPAEVIGPNSCNKEQENLTLTCRVSYRGGISPLLEWKTVGTDDAVTQGIKEEKQENLVTSHLTVSNQPALDGSSYICLTKQTQLSCTSSVVNVIYVIASNFTQRAAIGDTIQCTANSSTSCRYRWKWFKGDDVITASHNRTLVPKQSGNFRCEADCTIRKENCFITAMFAHVEVGSGTSTTGEYASGSLYVAVIIPIVILCAIIMVIIVLFLRIKKGHWKKGGEQLLATENGVVMEMKSSDDILVKYSQMRFLDKGISGEINGPFDFRGSRCVCQRIMYCVSSSTEDEVCRQGRVWMKLKHRNVLMFKDIIFRAPALYVVMEYAQGGSVRKALSLCVQDLKGSIVKNWATQIADGMNYLHSREIVHGRLKAAQILIMEPFDPTDPSPNALKIASYRLTTIGGQSEPGSFKGMFGWMAPEVIRGEQVIRGSDVWSYGVTVWEILTRVIPYKGKGVSQVDVIKELTAGNCTLLIPCQSPETIRELLKECWHPDANSRPTFSDILSSLQTANDMPVANC